MAEAQDLQRLVVSLEANYRKLEKELAKANGVAQKSARKIEKDFEKSNRGIAAGFAALGRDVSGRLDAVAGRAGAAGGFLRALAPASIVATAGVAALAVGIGALTVGLGAAVGRLAETERITNRLAAVLRLTGNAAGMTVREVHALARDMEQTTGRAANEVLEAAAALATFTSIGQENFQRTLKIANDIAEVFGGNLRENVDRVARALDDPLEGFAALRRAGFSLADAEREVVEELLRIGDVAGAQQVVLRNLEQQVGGAAAAGSQGLTGSFNQAKTAVANFFDELAKKLNIGPIVQRVLEGVTGAVNTLTEAMAGPSRSERIEDITRRVAELTLSLDELRQSEPFGGPGQVDQWRRQVESVQAVIDALMAEKAALEDLEASAFREQIAARAEGEAARIETATERIAGQVAELEGRLTAFRTPTEQLAAFRDELEATRTALTAALEQGVDPDVVAAGIAAAEALYDRQVAQVQAQIDAQNRQTDAQRQGMEDRLTALRISLMNEEDAEKAAYARRLSELQTFHEAGLLNLQERHELELRLEEEHQKAIAEIEQKALDERLAAREAYTSAVAGIFGSLSQIVGREGEKQLRISKMFAVAQAIINTAQGVTKALASSAPPLNFIQAAAVAAAGAAQIAAIRRAQPGGGSVPSVGSAPSSAGAGDDASAGQQGRLVNIQIVGESVGRQQVRELIERIGEELRDYSGGGKVVLRVA